MFQPGDKFDKYTIVRKIGSGGMGDVYLAKNPFDADVVLKALHPDFATNKDVIERFHREGKIQYTLRHQNIVRVTDIVERDGKYALVVDYMKGRDLEARLLANGPLSTEEIVRVSTRMLDALQTAHDHGYIHRDLKPANIFLEEVDGAGWEPRLMDFGIAKIQEAGALTRAQEFCGTPCYASPEQIASTKDVSPLTDVYSFGVVMWSMCTGVEPYAQYMEDPYRVLAAVVREQLPPLPDDVTPWLRAIIEKATQKNPTQRFASAAAFRDAIIHAARRNALTGTVADFKHVLADVDEALAMGDTLAAGRLSGATVAVDGGTGTAIAQRTVAPATTPTPNARTPMPPSLGAQPASTSARQAVASDTPLPRPTPAASASGPRAADPDPSAFTHESDAFERNAPVEREVVRPKLRDATTAEVRRAQAVEASFRKGPSSLDRATVIRRAALGALALAVVAGAAVGYRWWSTRPGQAPDGFVRIEPGVYTRGSAREEPGRGRDEATHQVTITRPFALQTHEVTVAEWRAFMFGNPSSFTDCGDECPMVDVSWSDAARYANRRSLLEEIEICYEIAGDGTVRWPRGLDCAGYRLPTEAEWEYAARAGTTTPYYNGNLEHTGRTLLDPRLTMIGWYGANSNAAYSTGMDCSSWGEGRTKCGPQAVGERRANAWGLHDMAGNAAEWVWDLYGPYPDTAVADPIGAATGTQRVIRGGSWRDVAERCRSASRDKNDDVKRNFVGVRLARTLR